MSLFRSAQMKYFTIHIPKEDTYQVISSLAEHNFVEFINSAKNTFHKPYYNSLKRCEEAISKVKLIMLKTHKEGIEMGEIPNVEFVFENHREYLKKYSLSSLALLDRIEENVESKFEEIQKSHRSLSDYSDKVNQLEDYKYLLFKAREVFHSKDSANSEIDFDKYTFEQLRLVNISGIIEAKDLQKFTKMIFRVTKGNSILYTFNIPQEYANRNGKVSQRTAFICVIEAGGAVLSKINRICESFGAKKYKLPSNKDEIFEKIKEIEDSITDTKQLLVMAEKNYQEDLQDVVGAGEFQCSKFDAYRIILERQSIIFRTLNFMEEINNIMLGGIWVPTEKIGLLHKLVPSFVSLRESEAQTKPPTYFEMNEFTASFQQVVNTYGIPRYQEVNPALYAIPIFPFLFGVMFGDIGHGGILLALAIWFNVSASAKKMLPDIYAIRYMLLLMGIFSFYSGWIYNQFFSIPLNVFGSCYGEADEHGNAHREENDCVYPFGFDPKWFRASNDLNYFNSFKMKFAVIIGVTQMSFAILLKMMNTYYFKNYLDFFFQWIPQQLFFFCTFGYMCILIIYKWTVPWVIERDSSTAPSIIGQMIAMPLKLGSTEGKPLWDQQSQQALQYNLLMISLICVPLMLIPKPLIIWMQSKPHPPKSKPTVPRNQSVSSEEDLNQKLNEDFIEGEMNDVEPGQKKTRASKTSSHKAGKAQQEEHDMSEIAVHQIIETIEFVLGSISNTASYLRLWALSLAHGQLSKVFLEKTIGGGIESANFLTIVIGMYLFFNITLGVIMGMDSMECFLHALRLQWVEFQSKFYKADGWKFMPLSFVAPIQAKANESHTFD